MRETTTLLEIGGLEQLTARAADPHPRRLWLGKSSRHASSEPIRRPSPSGDGGSQGVAPACRATTSVAGEKYILTSQ